MRAFLLSRGFAVLMIFNCSLAGGQAALVAVHAARAGAWATAVVWGALLMAVGGVYVLNLHLLLRRR